MSTYHARIDWSRGDDAFAGQKYSRGHRWHFDEGLSVPASAGPHSVKGPWFVAAAVDPEEAVVAAVASCHMLFFLAYCSKAGYIVESYADAPEGEMTKNAMGKEHLSRYTLRPVVTYRGNAPSAEEFDALHHKAHEDCYIANSVVGTVTVTPTLQTIPA